MKTPIRKLGRTDLELGALGMGCWAIGGPLRFGDKVVGWGAVDDDQSIKAIHKALDLGVGFFDTADVYGAGHSERILAKALGGQRQAVFLATKFGFTFKEDVPEITGTNASRRYISSACDASLRRLNTDIIDLYQLHLNDYDPEKSPEILEELELLVRKGKIRYYGWSTDDPGRALRLAKGEHCAAIQHQLNRCSADDFLVRAGAPDEHCPKPLGHGISFRKVQARFPAPGRGCPRSKRPRLDQILQAGET